MDVVIKPTSEAEWPELRKVRLEALAEAPTAFGSTLAESVEFPEARWRAWARGSGTSHMFLAWMGEEAIGLSGVILEAEHAEVVSLWVRPDQRGRGVARRLVEAAMTAAVEASRDQVRLWVTEANPPARALYERLGFQPTGESQPLPSNPSLPEIELAVRLRS